MPTLEPRFAGFTNTGNAKRPDTRRSTAARPSAHSRRDTDSNAAVGRPRAPNRIFIDGLVHADRRRHHAGADVRHVGQLEQALDRPVFAVGSVQHRERDVEVQLANRGRVDVLVGPARAAREDQQGLVVCRARGHHHFAVAAERAGLVADVLPRLGVGGDLGRAAREGSTGPRGRCRWRPVVPLPVEVREHGRRRAHRHLVLARPPAEEYADPFSLHRTNISRGAEARGVLSLPTLA